MPYISPTKQVIDLSLTYVVHAINVWSNVKYFYRKLLPVVRYRVDKLKPNCSIFSITNQDKQMKLVGIIV